MRRAGWTRSELRGHALVHVVDLTFAGRTFRLATRPVDVESAGGWLGYAGSLDELVWSRSLDLFSLQPEPESILLSGFLPADVAALVAAGHSLEGCPVQVSQVRVRQGPAAGALEAVDTWERRRPCLTGRVADVEYGAAGDQGAYVRFSAERNLFDSTSEIPLPHHRVNDRTWKVPGRLGASDVDLAYPIILGYPGRDDSITEGWITGSVGVWLNKQRFFNVLCLGLAPIAAESVWLNTDDDPIGREVAVHYSYSNAGATLPSRDKLGTLLAVVDYKTEGYDAGGPTADQLPASYRPSVNSSDMVFVGWPAGSGGYLWRGKLLRDAGDVLEWAMEQSDIPVDFAAFAAARPQLSWCKVDTALDEACNPVEWVTEKLLPLLPVTLRVTEAGVSPWVWNPNATRADAVCHLDADTDPSLDTADTVKCDASNLKNSFELKYSYSRRAEVYTHTARLGPKRIETTAQAKSRILLTRFGAPTATPAKITVYARATGRAGTNITVNVSTGAGALAVTESGRTVSIAIDASSTADDVVAAINSGSTLIEADTDEESADTFASTTTASVRLLLADFGTAGSPVCARSWSRLVEADKPGANAGLRLDSDETLLLYDHGSAARVLEWKAAAYALPHRRVELTAPESEYGWLDLGAYITFTSSKLGFDEVLGIVEGIDFYSDGTVGLRLLFIETAAAPAMAA